MKSKVFASTFLPLLQRRTSPNPLLCAPPHPPPPIGLKYFFNSIDVFTKYLKSPKSDTRKRHSLLVKHFCNSPHSIAISAQLSFARNHFQPSPPSLRFKSCETYTCLCNLGSNLVSSFNSVLAFVDTRLAKCYIRPCLHGGGIAFLKGLPFEKGHLYDFLSVSFTCEEG